MPRVTGKSKPGRLSDKTRKRAEGPIPRSLGIAFEYIRRDPDLGGGRSARALDEHFRSKAMEVASKGFSERLRKGTKKRGSRIYRYENAKLDPAFGTQHRYGTISGTISGVIHVSSLVYACLRCAAGDKANRKVHLDEAREVARKLQAFARVAAAMVEDTTLMDTLKEDPHEYPMKRMAHGEAVIGPLLKAYREG